MKVLILGYGSMGRRHAANALTLGCDVAIYDPARDAEQVVRELLRYTTHNADQMRQQQIAAFAREDVAWAWGPDAVVIATPAATHSELCWRAIKLGLPIMVEKPLALSGEDWWKPYNLQKGSFEEMTTGRAGFMKSDHVGLNTGDGSALVHVAFNWRFHPLVCAFRQKAATLGPARVATIWIATDMRTWPGASYADALLECSHELDLALDLFGPAELGPYAPERDALRDAWRLELHHASGCRTIVTIVGLAARPARGLRAMFDEYEGGYDVPPGDPRSAEALDISYARELRYFLDEAAGRTPPDYEGSPRPASLRDGLEVLRLVDRARIYSAP